MRCSGWRSLKYINFRAEKIKRKVTSDDIKLQEFTGEDNEVIITIKSKRNKFPEKRNREAVETESTVTRAKRYSSKCTNIQNLLNIYEVMMDKVFAFLSILIRTTLQGYLPFALFIISVFVFCFYFWFFFFLAPDTPYKFSSCVTFTFWYSVPVSSTNFHIIITMRMMMIKIMMKTRKKGMMNNLYQKSTAKKCLVEGCFKMEVGRVGDELHSGS